MQDRISTYQGRVTLTPVSGQVNTYDMVRADSPEQAGTPLNTENLLSQRASATILTLAGVEPENPSEAFIQLSKVLYPLKKEAVGIASGSYSGTGATGTFLSETFTFTPMVIIVIDSTGAAGTSSNPAALYTFFAVQGASQLSRLDHNGYETPVDVTWDDYTITMANGTGLNTSGHIYKWVVIGQIPDTGVIDEDEIDWEAAVLALIDPTLTLSDHAADAKAVGDAIDNLQDAIDGIQTVSIDETLSVSGQAADAAAVGEALANVTGSLTADVKEALLACFAHVAWADGNGQTYYDDLYDALYPPASLTRITATYTQSGTVYDNQTLDSLKSNLVVRAYYDNATSETVSAYTLSGTLTAGTSTITVTYGGKSATFTVAVTHATAQYTITNNLTNCTNSNSASVINELTAYSGTLTADADYVMGNVVITMGGTDVTGSAYNSSTGAISISSVTGNIVITATATEPPVTMDAAYPITLTWNPSANTYNLSSALGESGKQYRVEIDIDSISSTNAFVRASVTGAGGTTTTFADFDGDNIGKTGTLAATATLNSFTAGAYKIQLSCNKGTETANQTAVVSGFRIYEVV